MATPEELLQQAQELYDNKQYQEILELLTDEVLEQYKDGLLYNIRGIVCNDLGLYDNAISNYSNVIELMPDFVDAYNSRGISLKNKGEYDKAIADYTTAIKIMSNNAIAYYNRAISWNYKDENDKAIVDYSKAIVLKPDFVEAYYNRGFSWKNKQEYDKAIIDFGKAIKLKPDYVDAYNNRGLSWKNKGNFDKAIADFDKAIALDCTNVSVYNNRGVTLKNKGEYDKAIADYTKAIALDSNYANAYYNRGNARRKSGKELEESIKDFEKYLDLTSEKDDVWAKRAKDFIEDVSEKIKDKELAVIGDLVSKIKKLLLITEGCITHYTGLSVLQKLILKEDNLFRISEGSFLNDTSEGTELFNYLKYQLFNCKHDGIIAAPFAPKPFIGSFVAESKHDDLNLWRFYGKEDGVEAQGCAITVKMNDFIAEVNKTLAKGKKEVDKKIEDDINFYRVAYWDHETDKPNFYIPNSKRKEESSLKKLMQELKEKVNNYRREDRSVLEKYLNSIAFLFKSDAYKNENEIRLVIKGIEFEKKRDSEFNPPKVYIELVNIRNLVKQVTLGPKVSKPDEWGSAIYYSYSKTPEKRPERILISRLPFK
ncbi:MAG: tetratricopeptide repeat protein [Bacteroidota bacterium]|nr:tetratricopeptide repeat protein [Bacteroidota bacterium]